MSQATYNRTSGFYDALLTLFSFQGTAYMDVLLSPAYHDNTFFPGPLSFADDFYIVTQRF
ncbi:hypothetical protein [Sporomusa sp. KB1]|uniref:hypothetical protein n=1 Tax=Sporomusa sp. KB1 TaxID=943346 RepID=UPI001C9523E5|nr:hypothetical protein [Sporomusa sp. KB1]